MSSTLKMKMMKKIHNRYIKIDNNKTWNRVEAKMPTMLKKRSLTAQSS